MVLSPTTRLRELALFAGAGGGILGGLLLGWRTVCAVEIDPFCREVLRARQLDGVLPFFPIFEDVKFIKLDSHARIFYDSRYYEIRQEKEGIPSSNGTISEGSFRWGDCSILQKNPPSNVGVDEIPRCGDASTAESRNRKSLLQGRKKSKRSGAKHLGESRREGACDADAVLRAMWCPWTIPGWKNINPGSSHGLQPAITGDVVMSDLSPQLAQTLQSCRKEVINGEPDRIAYVGDIDVISGGFP